MTGGVVNIGYVELVGASLLMLVAGIVSWRMGLGQSRRIVVSTVRAFLQLLAMGLLLGYLFKYQTWWLVCLVLLGMCVAATQIATGLSLIHISRSAFFLDEQVRRLPVCALRLMRRLRRESARSRAS